MKRICLVFAAALGVAACAPRIAPLQPVMRNGEVLPATADAAVAAARLEGDAERERVVADLAEIRAAALAGCRGDECAAVARGEVLPGMTEAQLLAATGTTREAWEVRGEGTVRVLSGRDVGGARPEDAVSEIAWASLENGRVRTLVRQEPQGLRAVTSPADATLAGRAAAQAEALLRQGDEYVVSGDLGRALERYDRADVLRPGDAQTTLRIARVLDKQLRPVQAALQYRLFIHQLELERIRARGEAAAQMAAAIAAARERIIVLERR